MLTIRSHCRLYSTPSHSVVCALLKNSNVVETNVAVQGWVTNVIKMGKTLFVHITDGQSPATLQAVVPRSLLDQSNPDVTLGSAVTVAGDWKPSLGSQQPMELVARAFRVVGRNDTPAFPFSLKAPVSPDELRRNLHLRPKNQSFASLLRLRSVVTASCHRFFQDNGFVHIDAPLISHNDCEGAGQAFAVVTERTIASKHANEEPYQFFDGDVFLPVSGQLHLEAAVGALPKVYTLNPAFRAERSMSRQHLAEFRMVEAELAFVDSLEDVMQLSEQLVRYCATQLTNQQEEIASFHQRYCSEYKPLAFSMSTTAFPRISFDEAIKILAQHSHLFSSAASEETGLMKEHERFLVQHCASPVFVTKFPTKSKPFYMKRTEDERYAVCFDLLAPIVGELAGGSEREDNYEKLMERATALSNLDWYTDLRRFGGTKSGGFGIGFERLLQTLLGVANIKDCIPFPRWYKNCQL